MLSAAVHRHREEETSRQAALHDPLTGLPNRTLALDRLAQALERRRRDGSDVAALMLDLDRFKVINDSLGHYAGDELLLALAPRLLDAMRAAGHGRASERGRVPRRLRVTRRVRQVIGLAERVAEAIGQPIASDSGEHFMTTSIGIAMAAGRDTPESLLRDADAAMYRAKRRGPGRYEMFDERMRDQVLARLRIEAELRRALDTGSYASITSPSSTRSAAVRVPRGARTVGASPARPHPPLDFIPIAEETGLIIDLGGGYSNRLAGRAPNGNGVSGSR